MTHSKTQFKKRANEIKEKLENLLTDIEELQSDLENESADIEPYENKNDLTDAQYERQEWLDEQVSNVEQAQTSVQDAIDYLEYLND